MGLGDRSKETDETDERAMVEGLTQELRESLKLNFTGRDNDLDQVVGLLSAFIDARIELHAAQMRPIDKLVISKNMHDPKTCANSACEYNDTTRRRNCAKHGKPAPYICGEHIYTEFGHTNKSFNDDIEKICNSIRANNGVPMVIESIADALAKNLEPLPAFIPLTENNPTEIRNGDLFNVDGKTCQIRFERKYIPGLREIEIKPFAGYEPVKPGNPYEGKDAK